MKGRRGGGLSFRVGLNRRDPRINLATPIFFSRSCGESLYTRMSESWPCASLRLSEKESGRKDSKINKNLSWSSSSLPLHPSRCFSFFFEAAVCEECQKFRVSSFCITFCQVFLLPLPHHHRHLLPTLQIGLGWETDV